MESEENLSLEKQNSENNTSVENSLTAEVQPTKPLGKGSKSPSIDFPKKLNIKNINKIIERNKNTSEFITRFKFSPK